MFCHPPQMTSYPLVMLAATVTAVLSVVDDELYCTQRYARLCQEKGLHVACRYPNPGPGEDCENYEMIEMDAGLKNFITDYINKLRQNLASGRERVRGGARVPKPELMMFVEWDRELAQLAQRLADQCLFVHDECRATVRYPHAGQSVGEVRMRRSPDSRSRDAMTLRAVRRVLDAWWSEKRRVEIRQLFQPFRLGSKGAVWGHFSQLAVWSLRAVGCGATRHGSGHPRLLIVCDFSHTNMLGERTLKAGPLAQCPGNTKRMGRPYSLLCAARNTDNMQRRRHEEDNYNDEDTEVDETTTRATRTRPRSKMTTETTSVEVYADYSETEELRVVDTNLEDEEKKYANKINLRNKIEGYTEDNYINPLREDETSHGKRVTMNLKTRQGGRDRSGQYSLEKFKYDRRLLEKYGPIPALTGCSRYDIHEEFVTKRRSTVLHVSTEDRPIRRKWQQERFRPKRPGAAALFTRPQGRSYSRTARVSLMLDKEDHDQFFKDTGFSISGAKENAPNERI